MVSGGALTQAAAEEQRQHSVSPVRQAPSPQTFTTTSPVQSLTPAGHQLYGQQYNPPGLNSTGSIRQYNPPGLQGSPNPNTQHPEMAMPGGLGAAGGAARLRARPVRAHRRQKITKAAERFREASMAVGPAMFFAWAPMSGLHGGRVVMTEMGAKPEPSDLQPKLPQSADERTRSRGRVTASWSVAFPATTMIA